MKRFKGLILSLIISSFCNAQNINDKEFYLVDLSEENISETELKLVDSCLNVYHKSAIDTLKFKAINTIVEETWNDNIWPKYNFWIYENIQERLSSDEKYYQKLYAGCLINIGYYYRVIGNIDSALSFYNKSYNAYNKLNLKDGIAYCLNNMGVIYDNQGKMAKALECYHGSMKLQEEIDDKEGLANSLSNIGEVHKVQGEDDKALEYFNKSLLIQKEINNKRGEAMTLVKIGDIYRENQKYDKSEEYFNKSLTLSKIADYKSGIATALRELGTMKAMQDDYQESLELYKESTILFEEIGDIEELTKSYINLAVAYLNSENIKESKKYALKAHGLASDLGFTEVISSSANALSSVYEMEGNSTEALKMFKLHVLMRDSIHNAKNEKMTIRRQVEYDYDKQKALDDAKNEKIHLLEQKEIEKQKIIKYSIFIVLLMVIVFLIFVFNRLIITRSQKIIIEETNNKLNETNEELATQRDEIEVQKNVVEQKNKEITDSIIYAKRIQNAILPSANIISEFLPNSFVHYKPKDVVAGDFYWLEQVEGAILFAAADCTGHGVPGAMVSVVCHNAMNRAVREFGLTEPGLILDKTREIVVAEFEKSEDDVRDGMDIALCSLKDNILKYSGAHNPLWIVRNNEILEIKADKQPIGKYEMSYQYVTHTLQLEKGDLIYIFSDGYADQFGGENDKKFGSKRLKQLFLSFQYKTMNEQNEILKSTFENWIEVGGGEQIDDVCVMGVKIS